MTQGRLQQPSTWAEDRALLGSTPSADPGVEAEGRAGSQHPGSGLLQNTTFSINIKAENPTSNRSATRNWSSSQLANISRPKFQFTLNQDSRSSGYSHSPFDP